MNIMVRALSFLLLMIFFITSYADNNEKLVFAIDIIRHGDRTPTNDIVTMPHAWKEGAGQLTAKGMRQEYELGKKFRHRYVEYYHLLPPQYESATLYVRSTDLDRTLMSAQSVMLGLYPLQTGPMLPGSQEYALPQGYQPIPIHTISNDQELLLVPDHDNYHYKDLLKKYMYKDTAWQARNAALKNKYPAWSKATGVEIKDVYQLKPIADALFVRKLYHVPLPSGLTETDAEEIYEAGEWAFTYPFANPDLNQLTAARLFETICTELKNASEHRSAKKYLLFSSHDSTIMGQMAILQVPLTSIPPYSSDLNILLFQRGENNFYVKVMLNDQPVSIPKCGGTECSLSQFVS